MERKLRVAVALMGLVLLVGGCGGGAGSGGGGTQFPSALGKLFDEYAQHITGENWWGAADLYVAEPTLSLHGEIDPSDDQDYGPDGFKAKYGDAATLLNSSLDASSFWWEFQIHSHLSLGATLRMVFLHELYELGDPETAEFPWRNYRLQLTDRTVSGSGHKRTVTTIARLSWDDGGHICLKYWLEFRAPITFTVVQGPGGWKIERHEMASWEGDGGLDSSACPRD